MDEPKHEYNWEKDRDQIGMSVEDINRKILFPLQLSPCVSSDWLHVDGQFFVNKVFKLTMLNSLPLVLKISHPYWNGKGKCHFESLSLQYLKKLNIPTPKVLGYYSPIDPLNIAMSNPELENHRLKQIENGFDYEWILMEFVEAETLGKIWTDLSWDNRKLYIEEVVKYLAPLSTIRFKRTGQITNYETFEVVNHCDYCPNENIKGFSTQWKDTHVAKLTKIEKEVNNKTEYKILNEIIPQLFAYLNNSAFASIPINFTVGDVAPKNLLVDVKESKIVSFIDMEWAGADFIGHDINEMVYPLNESDLKEGKKI